MRFKKLIAREGLVILGILTFSLILSFISHQINRPMHLLPLDDWIDSPKVESDAIDKIIEIREKYPQYNDFNNIELAKAMSQKYPDWESVYQVMQRINDESTQKHYKYNYALSKPSIFNAQKISEFLSKAGQMILMFGYPVYFLIRFILWAIKTLKE